MVLNTEEWLLQNLVYAKMRDYQGNNMESILLMAYMSPDQKNASH